MDDFAELEAEIAELEARGDASLAPVIAERMAALGTIYAEHDEDTARETWDKALVVVEHLQDARGWVAAGRVWSAIHHHRMSRDIHGAADAAAEALRLYQRALPLVVNDRDAVIAAYLYVANSLGAYHFVRDNKSGGKLIWGDAIALLQANPQLPLEPTHARLYLNHGKSLAANQRIADALQQIDISIDLYREFADDSWMRVELARAWQTRAEITTDPAEQRQGNRAALSLYKSDDEHIEVKHDIAEMHHSLGHRARNAGRFADAVPHQTRAVDVFSEVVEEDPTPRNRTTLAAYRAALALALGGSHAWTSALDDAREVIGELEVLLAAKDNAFARTMLMQLREQLPEWTRKLAPLPDVACSLCSRRRRETKKIISGPNVYICDECVSSCLDILEAQWPLDPVTKERAGTPKRNAKATRCDFCGMDERRAFISGQSVAICDDCVDLCAGIIDEETRAIERTESDDE